MRQISKEAGIALGGIYNHFATKEDIFGAVFITYHPYNEVVPAVQQAQGDTIEDLLHNVARFMVEGLTKSPTFLNLLFIDLVEFHNAFTSQVVGQEIPVFEEIYARLIQKGGGRMRPMPPLIMARSFFGLFFSYYITGIFLRSVPNLPSEVMNEHAFDYFIDIYLHGILIPEQNDEKGGPV